MQPSASTQETIDANQIAQLSPDTTAINHNVPLDSANFNTPPTFEGPLAKNYRLTKATKLYKGLSVFGHESLVFHDGYVYTGTADGKVIRIKGGNVEVVARFGVFGHEVEKNETKCGRPLGLRMDHSGNLLVVDSYLGTVDNLITSNRTIDGYKPIFLNDVVVTATEMIYVTESSLKWCRAEYLMTGLEMNPDGRCYIRGDKKGQVEIFSDNLPGLPDNIRRNPSGNYWVALTVVRHPNGPVLPSELYAPYPSLRRLFYKWHLIKSPKAAQNEPVPLGAMLRKGAVRDNLPPVARALAGAP
ncbi:hypothetical protein LSH36_838g01017 [Paralvinella palmiformis]|uniref:Adipocyte plasma membrane-associated protein n=1 Tax=Paralvinella palmiformis TaxID=53620 RepID=A0AAD9IYY4_9ANNE|nr:hypothetical protein LSH36_838g01017 [Paralvinella palmiformis]